MDKAQAECCLLLTYLINIHENYFQNLRFIFYFSVSIKTVRI